MMLRTRVFMAALPVAVAAAASMAAERTDPPAPMFPDAGAFGVVVHTPFRAQALRDVNVQWVRVNVRWGNVEKESRGNYDWAGADELLNYYLDNGFHVMCVLTMEDLCPLYEADKDDKDVVIGAAVRWCGAAAARYAGKGILWELGNEPEAFPMGGYWNDPVTYTKMATQAANAIKSSDATAKVAALSTAWMDKGFIEKTLEEGLLAGKSIDVLTYHGYHRHTLLPESGLAEDVGWLRGRIAEYAPQGHHVIAADSERGYAIVPFLEKKSRDSWRNLVYCESEQAAYCARHYLETIFLGVEIAVWYKDMRGENDFSLYYGTEEDPRGLRPMGHVYRNLASLLPDNPTLLRNGRYEVTISSAPHGDVELQVRSYLQNRDGTERLIAAAWNPLEAFDGRILDNRKRIRGDYYEAWRAVSEEDAVEVAASLHVNGLAQESIESVQRFNLLSKTTDAAYEEAAWSAGQGGGIECPVAVSPMPSIIVIRLK